jgi:hypothetical protein
MKNTTMRTIGVISLVLFIVTIGFAAAQAAQPLDSSLIPTVVTDRPLTSAETTVALPDQTATPAPVVTVKTAPTQATPTRSTNTGPSDQGSSRTSADRSADSDREVVKRSVRDDEHDDEDKQKSKSDDHDEDQDKVKSDSDGHDDNKSKDTNQDTTKTEDQRKSE